MSDPVDKSITVYLDELARILPSLAIPRVW